MPFILLGRTGLVGENRSSENRVQRATYYARCSVAGIPAGSVQSYCVSRVAFRFRFFSTELFKYIIIKYKE